MWIGSKAAHDAEVLADKMPYNVLVGILETGLFYRDKDGVETLITAGSGDNDVQVITMPTASVDNEARVVQYIGTSTQDYTHGYFYECTFDGTDYGWTHLDVDSGNSGQIQYTDIPAADAEHEGMIVQYLGDTNVNYHNGYFYKCVYDGDTYYWEQIDVQGQSSGQTIQVTSLDTPTAALLGKVYQYIGDTTADYKHGYFYECILDGAEYKWVNIKVQDSPDDIGLSVVNGKLCITYDNT